MASGAYPRMHREEDKVNHYSVSALIPAPVGSLKSTSCHTCVSVAVEGNCDMQHAYFSQEDVGLGIEHHLITELLTVAMGTIILIQCVNRIF